MKIVIATNSSWGAWNFRAGLIRALVKKKHEVIILSPQDEFSSQFSALGCRHVAVRLDQRGTHFGRDVFLFWQYWRFFRSQKIDVFLGFTIKPNIYGSMAASLCAIPVVNNITGLGTVFLIENRVLRLVKFLYRLAFFRSVKVFFQNEEDRNIFIKMKLIKTRLADILPGSGVDLEKFSPNSFPIKKGKKHSFLLVARMLWYKGIAEYVDAARYVKARHRDVEFCMLGELDPQDKRGVPLATMEKWVDEGVIRYLGFSKDVRPFLSKADCVVLPSLSEGTPRALLEAAAMECALIATDVPGCRDVVDEGKNGYLCKPKDFADLATQMEKFLSLSKQAQEKMKRHSRKKAANEFNETIIIQKYLEVLDEITTKKRVS